MSIYNVSFLINVAQILTKDVPNCALAASLAGGMTNLQVFVCMQHQV